MPNQEQSRLRAAFRSFERVPVRVGPRRFSDAEYAVVVAVLQAALAAEPESQHVGSALRKFRALGGPLGGGFRAVPDRGVSPDGLVR